MIDLDVTAARAFWWEVRKHALRANRFAGSSIVYETQPDERRDHTLAARRVYGRPEEFMVIEAAAGLSTADDLMLEQTLILPSEGMLRAIKIRTGFETIDKYRLEGGVPSWQTPGMIP